MSGKIVRRLKPEEEEVLRKREELAAIRTTLADRELELVDLKSQLAVFEGRYLRQVGTLYAELDEWKARIAELQARLDPSAGSKIKAEEAREQARQTYADAHGEASETRDFIPSPEPPDRPLRHQFLLGFGLPVQHSPATRAAVILGQKSVDADAPVHILKRCTLVSP